jgi:predicted DNA-binding transcriptional regulator AlpA
MEPLALRIDATSKAIGLSRSRIYELISEKKLQTTRVGSVQLVTMESIKALLASGAPEQAAA